MKQVEPGIYRSTFGPLCCRNMKGELWQICVDSVTVFKSRLAAQHVAIDTTWDGLERPSDPKAVKTWLRDH